MPGDIITVAGGGTGDGGEAVNADIRSTYGAALDSSGNLYIADCGDNRVRKVDGFGVITTVAGTGGAGYSGDGGPAVSASLNCPSGVFVDPRGNLYIADRFNNRICKVDTTGVITTVAGNGIGGFSGDGDPATSASIKGPFGVAVDAPGNIYIVDYYNNRIRKVDAFGVITTVAGNGTTGPYSGDGGAATSASLYGPTGISVDASGNLFIAVQNNQRVHKVNASGIITTVAGNGTAGYSGDGGTATAATLYFPSGVFIDVAGNIYISDNNNNRIRRVNTSGVITTVAGNGTPGYSGDGGLATSASLKYPFGTSVDVAGNIYIVDTYNGRIRKVDTTGVVSTVAGNGTSYFGDGGVATAASLAGPAGIFADSSGSILIADRNNHRIRRVDASGVMTTVAGSGTAGYSGDAGSAVSANLFEPYDVAVDPSGNMYIADSLNNRIRKVDTSGVITTVAGNGTAGYSGDGGLATSASLNKPIGIATDLTGNIYIADSSNNRIRKVDTSGVITTVVGNGTAGYSGDGGLATSASLNKPSGIATDLTGNIYIADSSNNRIRKVDTSGVITTVAGDGTAAYSGDDGAATSASINFPTGVFVDTVGNIYIADYFNHRIRRADVSGIITTIAGNGLAGYSGDEGPAASASLYYARHVFADAGGGIYIADSNNNRIRKVIGAGQPSGTINVNSNAVATNSSLVVLTLACDDGTGSACTETQFSNDSLTWSTPEPFGTGKSWTLAPGDGLKTVYAKFRNQAGTWSDASHDSITLDMTPPMVAILSPTADPTRDSTPLLNYNVKDTTAVTVIVKVDGAVVPKVSGNSLDTLADGQHTIRVEAIDAVGNAGAAQATFSVDATPPAITISAPLSGFTNNASPTLLYTVSDGTVVVKVDGVVVVKQPGDILGPFAEGQHIVRVEAADALGNVGFVEVAFMVDTIPPAVAVFSKIVAAPYYSVALKSDGTLWAWGWNSYGELGDGTTAEKHAPVQIGKESAWTFAAAGYNHTVALKSDGTLWAWGRNNVGQLGDGTKVDKHSPIQIGTDNRWVAVAAGGYYSLGLKSDGTAWSWGDNTYGQLGDGTTMSRTSPVQVGTDTAWAAIKTGAIHTIALKNNGTLWVWGGNGNGQLGDGTTINRVSPVQVGTDTTWTIIAAGRLHSAAIKSNGSLWAWGNNVYGQLGDGTTATRTSPVRTGTDADWVSVAGGLTHTGALKSNGTLWVWGYNSNGQLGNPGIHSVYYPVRIGKDVDWSSITADQFFTAALKSDGSLWAWGDNMYGQLGDGTIVDKSVPTKIGTIGKFVINDGAAKTNCLSVSLAVTATDINGVAEMQFSNDGTTWSAPEPYTATKTWTLSSGDGLKTVYGKFKDNAENWSVAYSGSILLDSTAPVVSITSPVAGITNVNTPLLSYSVSDGAVVVKVDDVVVSKVSGNNLDQLTDGTHKVKVEATDAASNPGFAEVIFMVDTVPPTVGISPVVTPTNVNAQTITGTREADAVITASVNTSATLGAVTYPTATTWNFLITGLAEGTNHIIVTAKDAAGNSATATVDITYDSVPPAVGINPVVTPTKINSQTITGTRESGATVTVSVNTAATPGPVSYPTSTTWNCTITGLVYGVNNVTAKARDAAGNTATVTASITERTH